MKNNLILKKFSTNSVPGTMNQKELRTFFGGKIIYSEDNIYINNDSINFSQVVSDINNGYQYYDVSLVKNKEVNYYENLTDLKANNQSISLFSQNSASLNNNTKWEITINGSTILKDYLFFKIKEQRVFKNINSDEVYSNDINNAIYEYINANIFGRYRLNKIDFYVNYYDIKTQSIQDNIYLQYNPNFDVNVYKSENLSNMNIAGFDPYKFDLITIQYSQSKPSNQYSFNYYFDLNFTKI
ncbi:hypothetical protein M0Q97_00935 [Candidatus Dojkabacteria bacterium]|jgi:hypothetical protein|nr:hypothetical protein [Candidatus Dojkabacteria bacterium]